jgi:hypothetical protein
MQKSKLRKRGEEKKIGTNDEVQGKKRIKYQNVKIKMKGQGRKPNEDRSEGGMEREGDTEGASGDADVRCGP